MHRISTLPCLHRSFSVWYGMVRLVLGMVWPILAAKGSFESAYRDLHIHSHDITSAATYTGCCRHLLSSAAQIHRKVRQTFISLQMLSDEPRVIANLGVSFRQGPPRPTLRFRNNSNSNRSIRMQTGFSARSASSQAPGLNSFPKYE